MAADDETKKPKRIQRSRAKGWRMPEGAVYVGRPTQWGNPFEVSKHLNRAAAVELFRALCERNYRVLRSMPWTAGIELSHGPRRDVKWAEPLRGKDLACWCPLDQPCHADVLLELANAEPPR